MVDLVLVLISAVICQAIVDQLKNLVKFHKGKYFKGKINLKVLVSMVVALAMCLNYGIDLLMLVGLGVEVTVVGSILTAIIISAGASGVHDLIEKIKEIQGGEK